MARRSISTLMAALGLMWLMFPVPTAVAGDTGNEKIRNAVREYIETSMPWPKGTARVEFLSADTEPVLPKKNITLRIDPNGNGDFIGETSFLVRYLDRGAVIRSDMIRTRIEVLRDHVVAAKNLSTGAILTDEDLTTVRRWVHRINPQSVASVHDATGRRLSVQIRSGAAIMNYMLKDVPLVKKGQPVKVIFDNGLMRIATVGLPEEDGMAGAIIRVRNMTSNKIMYTRVLGDSLVSIEI